MFVGSLRKGLKPLSVGLLAVNWILCFFVVSDDISALPLNLKETEIL